MTIQTCGCGETICAVHAAVVREVERGYAYDTPQYLLEAVMAGGHLITVGEDRPGEWWACCFCEWEGANWDRPELAANEGEWHLKAMAS